MVGCFIEYLKMHGTTNTKYEEKLTISFVHSSLATYCREHSPLVCDNVVLLFGKITESRVNPSDEIDQS
jgi:hypothetical protein